MLGASSSDEDESSNNNNNKYNKNNILLQHQQTPQNILKPPQNGTNRNNNPVNVSVTQKLSNNTSGASNNANYANPSNFIKNNNKSNFPLDSKSITSITSYSASSDEMNVQINTHPPTPSLSAKNKGLATPSIQNPSSFKNIFQMNIPF